MDAKELANYEKILRREKERFLEANQIIEHGVRGHGGGLAESFSNSTGELSSYDNHPADQGDIMFERSKDIALRDNNRLFLQMIDDALERIDQGTYGWCDHCGQAIAKERLEAFPYTTMCLQCKEYTEKFTPLFTEEIPMTFAHSFTDDTENVGFDGEDTWQKVARYGTSNTPQDIPGATTLNDAFYDADECQGEVAWTDSIVDIDLDEQVRAGIYPDLEEHCQQGECQDED